MYTRSQNLLFATLVLGMTALAGSALALPPSTVTGIDLSTVLTLDDRARQFSYRIDADDEPRQTLTKVRTIVVDPGHGGGNSGATGVAEIKEKYLTLALAYRLRNQLQKKYPDVRVVLTRYWDADMSLTDRVHFANMMGADLFLSLHYNAAVHDRAVGFETYFLRPEEVTPGQQERKGEPLATAQTVATGIDTDDFVEPEGTFNDVLTEMKRDLDRERLHTESGVLAETVQLSLAAQLDSIDRGVKQANFAVLRGALMPAVVVEAGFLTHPEEGKQVLDETHRDKVVDALLEAVEGFDEKLAARE
jgi:N-acetylmuramoyl-L-alanine amidase